MKILLSSLSLFRWSLVLLCLLTLAAAMSPGRAAALADFTSAAYVAGPLNAQNGWSVQEQSPYNGAMTIVAGTGLTLSPTTNGSGVPIAFWPTTYAFGANKSFTNSINFNFTEVVETPATAGNIVSLHFELYANPYGNQSPLSVLLSRIPGTSLFKLQVSGTAGGTVTGTTSVEIPGSALGINFASGYKTSHPLQLAYTLSEGATAASWTVTGVLTDTLTRNTFNVNASITGATSYYTTTLTGAISSSRVNTGGTSVGDGLSNVTITQFGLNPLATGGTGTTGLPAPWQTADIGAVGVAGSATYASSTFTVKGSGTDIWGAADQFRSLYQGITGDFDLQARVVSQTNTAATAKAGIMIRNDLTAGAANTMLGATPGYGWSFHTRATAGGATTSVNGGNGTAPLPLWVRLIRAGNVFTAYTSTGGVNWTQVGTTTITMGATVYAGLEVVSCNNATLGTATFDKVTLAVPTGLGPGPGGGTVPANATLTFSEDFSGGTLDTTKWVPFYCNPGLIGNELEVYVPGAITFPAGGGLSIVASQLTTPFQGKSYASGAMTTYGNFSQTYGYFEVKAQIPKGKGFWPAFWLLPDTGAWPPEIDVMENLGDAPQTIYTTYHWTSGGTNYQDSVPTTGTDYSAGYHTYGVSWLPGSMIFYIDGTAVHTITGSSVSSSPMYLLLNLAVGGDWPGSPNASTPFPSSYKVAWVHAYQYNSAPVVAKSPIVFGPTALSSQTVHAGDVITVSSSLKVGATALVNPTVTMYVTTFWGGSGATNYSTTNKSVGACPANTKTPFTINYTVPATLTTGTYTIWYSVSDASTGKSASLYLAQRLTVP